MGDVPSDALTNREFLIWLHKLQQYRRFARKADGEYYRAEGYFKNQAPDWTPLMLRENRGTTLRLANQPCIACGEPLAANSAGDHIIPRSRGGPAGAENYLPLCNGAPRRCNSSKGVKDLLEWWTVRLERAVPELPNDVICAYARLKYQWHLYHWHASAGPLDDVAGPEVTVALVVDQVITALPPEAGRYFAGLARYSPLFGEFHPPRNGAS